jgi:hypothetical protein
MMAVGDQGLLGGVLPQHLQHILPQQLLNQQQAAQIH